MSMHDYFIIAALIIGGLSFIGLLAWIGEKINKK